MANTIRTTGSQHGHNQASFQWYTNLYGTNMHPREWNSINIEHADGINYGKMSAIDRAIVSVGKKVPVGPLLKDNPIPTMVFDSKPAGPTANWPAFYRKYLLSQAETKYDTARSLDTKKRSNNYINTTPRARAPTTATLHRPSAGLSTTYPK